MEQSVFLLLSDMSSSSCNQIELDQNIVDGARSMLTYSYAASSETVGAAAGVAYLDEVLKGVGKDWNKKMLETFPVSYLIQIPDVSPEKKLMHIDDNSRRDPSRYQAIPLTHILGRYSYGCSGCLLWESGRGRTGVQGTRV
jgi:hypothetical protein